MGCTATPLKLPHSIELAFMITYTECTQSTTYTGCRNTHFRDRGPALTLTLHKLWCHRVWSRDSDDDTTIRYITDLCPAMHECKKHVSR